MSDSHLPDSIPDHLAARPWFFSGIGGSGMLPLATILRATGAQVAGSDRSFDQGRTPDKRAWLESQGFTLFPQDGSGITQPEQILVASAAVEDTVPEVVRARNLGCLRITRAQLLAHLFNRAALSLAVGGTSGKSTVTGMLGWILTATGRDPTIMNGAVMKNFATPGSAFASARVGHGGGDLGAGGVFVSEVDESDGSIALYRPNIAVLLNVSLDHKSMAELRALFAGFLSASHVPVVNADDPEARALGAEYRNAITFGIEGQGAMIGVEPGTIVHQADRVAALVVDRREQRGHSLRLAMPGRHNLANALAAVAAASAAGVPVHDACLALAGFKGLARRFDILGTSPAGISVIDDFGHNPEKVAATLRTLKTQPGRVIAFFQPHGYGPLRQMGTELAETFARELDHDDLVMLCDPVYFGGTVDRSHGSERIIELVRADGGAGPQAEYLPTRDECAERIADIARPGDRIAIMGARDDTLTDFARSLLERLS